MEYSFGDDLRTRMAANLAAFEPVPCDDGSLRRAAVAVTVVRGEGGDGQAAVLLTRRSRHLRRHGGQFALPGGRLDPGETAPRAALRELHEELGLDLDAGAILGRLDDYPTRSGFRVTPLVVWGGAAADLRPDPDEVARVFRVPMAELDSPAVPRLRVEVEGRRPALMAPLPSVGGEVHSPTAAMLYQFREVALRGQATRVAHFEQSEFAWK